MADPITLNARDVALAASNPGLREQIARMIDPEAFRLRRFVDKRHPDVFNPSQLPKQEAALAKADAILALLDKLTGGEG